MPSPAIVPKAQFTARASNLRLVTPEAAASQTLPPPVPLMEFSKDFWTFKTLTAAREFGLFGLPAGSRSTPGVNGAVAGHKS